MCRPAEQSDSLDTEQMVEEVGIANHSLITEIATSNNIETMTQFDFLDYLFQVADMLRIISRTKDPEYLTKLLQDEILPRWVSCSVKPPSCITISH